MKPTRLLPLIPYVAVIVGLYCLGSAWAAIGLYHAGMIASVIGFRVSGKGFPETTSSKAWYLTAAIFAAGGLIFYLVWPYIDPAATIAGRLNGYGINRVIWPCFAVYFCVVNSLVEELFWRGLLGEQSMAVRPNDLFFAGYHALVLAAFVGPIWLIPVFVACVFAGWLWRALRTITGGLSVPVITHFAADASIVLAVHFRLFAHLQKPW